MKKLQFEKELGDSGAKASGSIGVEGQNLKASVSVEYPVEKIIAPATKAVDSLLDKLEAAIPGSWDKPLLEKVKSEYKEELLKLLQAE